MNAPPLTSMLRALPLGHRERLMRTAREVLSLRSLFQGTRRVDVDGRAADPAAGSLRPVRQRQPPLTGRAVDRRRHHARHPAHRQ
ncbi:MULTISPECIES: hypothetical protein [unclassified Streptomyces]|uniref:hypothetical protein n=1 Tax=unclassified Streptomyces TaxID=2593676 RepID=UPI003D903B19